MMDCPTPIPAHPPRVFADALRHALAAQGLANVTVAHPDDAVGPDVAAADTLVVLLHAIDAVAPAPAAAPALTGRLILLVAGEALPVADAAAALDALESGWAECTGRQVCAWVVAPLADEAVRDDLGDQAATSSLAGSLEGLASLLARVIRRSPDYFTRYPVTLPAAEAACAALRSDAAAVAIASAISEGVRGRLHLVPAAPIPGLSLAEAIAAAARSKLVSMPVSPGDDTNARLATRVAQALLHGAHREYPVDASLRQWPVDDRPGVLAETLTARTAAALASRAALDVPLASLPGARELPTARGALRYLRIGSGGPHLLLVHAFGLSWDFWTPVASALAGHATLLVPERPQVGQDGVGVPTTYYDTDNFVADFIADVTAVLDDAGSPPVHVVSWCGGGKLALELADAMPQRVRSLALLAPSFAGMAAEAGSAAQAESAYERNLQTMCQLVGRMPQTADGMAKNMRAILERGQDDLDRFAPGRPDRADVLELADRALQPQLYRPFLGGANLTAFSQQLLRFRSHDAGPAIDRLAACRTPMLMAIGRHDTTTSATRARALAQRLPGLESLEFEEGSHYLIAQDHAALARHLMAFIHRHEQAPPEGPAHSFHGTEPVLASPHHTEGVAP